MMDAVPESPSVSDSGVTFKLERKNAQWEENKLATDIQIHTHGRLNTHIHIRALICLFLV